MRSISHAAVTQIVRLLLEMSLGHHTVHTLGMGWHDARKHCLDEHQWDVMVGACVPPNPGRAKKWNGAAGVDAAPLSRRIFVASFWTKASYRLSSAWIGHLQLPRMTTSVDPRLPPHR